MTTLTDTALSVAQILAGAIGYHVVRNTPPMKKKFPTAPYLMYDQESADSLPSNGNVYLAYVDGPTANLVKVQDFVRQHAPKAKILTCTRDPSYLATVLDVENGAARISQCVAWFHMCVEHGIYRPTFYASLSNMSSLQSALSAGKVKRSQYRLIYAEWDNKAQIAKGYDGHQYSTGKWDTSILSEKFFPLSQL